MLPTVNFSATACLTLAVARRAEDRATILSISESRNKEYQATEDVSTFV